MRCRPAIHGVRIDLRAVSGCDVDALVSSKPTLSSGAATGEASAAW